MRAISLNLPQSQIEGLDELVRRSVYPSRAEAIRLAIRDLLQMRVCGICGRPFIPRITEFPAQTICEQCLPFPELVAEIKGETEQIKP